MSMVLRFAPSPTGLLHVGNARVALLNWLYARRHGGRFILRLDDTDQERSRPEFAQAIEEDLAWLGIDWDVLERQSARRAHYDAAVARLKAAGRLYPCYETEGELSWKRKAARQRHRPYIYDRKALELSDEDRRRLEAEGRTPHWRFLLKDGEVAWNDLCRGPCSFETQNLSDPVLIREDGSLLYLIASAVDDLDMGVTHLIRGEDHVSNTPAQIQLYAALGGDARRLRFGHMPLLAGAKGQQLSKRLGSLSLRELRNDGFEPAALRGLLVGLGTGHPPAPAEMDELRARFDLRDYSRNTPKFDPAELAQLNEKVVHNLSFEAAAPKLAACGLEAAGPAFWNAVRANCWRVAEARDWWEVVTGPVTPICDDPDYLAEAAALLPAAPFDATTWRDWTGALKAATGRKGKALFHPLRLALTGRERGPELAGLLPLIGRETVLARLKGQTM